MKGQVRQVAGRLLTTLRGARDAVELARASQLSLAQELRQLAQTLAGRDFEPFVLQRGTGARIRQQRFIKGDGAASSCVDRDTKAPIAYPSA